MYNRLFIKKCQQGSKKTRLSVEYALNSINRCGLLIFINFLYNYANETREYV